MEEMPDLAQYADLKYNEQLMAESMPEEDLPTLPRKGPAAAPASRGTRRSALDDVWAAPRGRGSSYARATGARERGAEGTMEISAQLVKQLRDKTGAGMMECKAALKEANGDLNEAEVVLRKKGIASATKKATRSTKQGVIGTYIHPGAQLGVMIEVNCESDFVARTEDFQELVHDLAMQVAAADPKFLRKEDVTEADLAKEREIYRARALSEGKPEKMLDKITEGPDD